MSLELDGSIDRVGVVAIEQLIFDKTISSARYFAEVASTNTAAIEAIRQGKITDNDLPRLYLADQQTAGRGRHGRTWISDNHSLTFSLLMRRTVDRETTASLWPIAVGVGIARAIEFCYAPIRSQLKWPNDVYLDGGKVAGILLEATHGTPDTIVIGIGVNVNNSPGSQDLDGKVAKSIAAVTGRPSQRYELLSPLVQQITAATDQLADAPQEIIADFRSRCILNEKQVVFQTGIATQSAICRGINEQGELILETDTGTRTWRSGEVNLRITL